MNDIERIYNLLYKRYRDLNWWPAGSPYEVMVGAVLTQNTAWTNVEMAIANFTGRLSPQFVENVSIEELIDIIRPAGFFNQKAGYLKAVTAWFKQYNYSVEPVGMRYIASVAKLQYITNLRNELLAVKGVGRETADSILLYALNLPTFVIDAYTVRLLTRIGFDVPKKYDDVKALFEKNLPNDVALFNNYHACIVINAKEHCRAKPVCDGCPLMEMCIVV